MTRKWRTGNQPVIYIPTFIVNLKNKSSHYFSSVCSYVMVYHDFGQGANLETNPESLYQQWIETYITDELEQQIKEEEALVNQFLSKAVETDKQKC